MLRVPVPLIRLSVRLLTLLLAPCLLVACDSGGPPAPPVGGAYQNVNVIVTPGTNGPTTTTITTDLVLPILDPDGSGQLLPGTRVFTTVFTRNNGELSDSLDFGGTVSVTPDSVVFTFPQGYPGLILRNGVRPSHFSPRVTQRIAAARRQDGALEWQWVGRDDLFRLEPLTP